MKNKAVLVTTEFRGVFFGYVKDDLVRACLIPKIGTPIKDFSQHDLIWAEEILTPQEHKNLKVPLWTLSGIGDGIGDSFGDGDGYGESYDHGIGDGVGYGYSGVDGDGDGAFCGYGHFSGHGSAGYGSDYDEDVGKEILKVI